MNDPLDEIFASANAWDVLVSPNTNPIFVAYNCTFRGNSYTHIELDLKGGLIHCNTFDGRTISYQLFVTTSEQPLTI